MAANQRQLVEKQIRRVRRRLMTRRFLENVLLFWAAALGVNFVWFLARPFLMSTRPDWLSYSIPASLLAATIGAAMWTIRRRPAFESAALALDEKFDLRERITTFFLLTPAQGESAVGRALLEDVQDKVARLNVASRFPIGVPWKRLLMPIGVAALCVAASFFDPTFGGAKANAAKGGQNPVDAKAVQDIAGDLRQAVKKEKVDALKSEKFKELDDEFKKLAEKALDPNSEEKIRERANEMRNLEEKMKERIEKLAGKADGKELKKQLEKLGLEKLGKKMKDGPAKDFQDALAKGKLDKAREALEKLRKDLDHDKLGKEEQKQLAEQMKDLQDQLQRLADNKDDKERLQKEFDDKKIDRDQLDREMDRLLQEAAEMQELKELAELLGECKECLDDAMEMKDGDNMKKLAGKLKGMIERLKEMELSDAELAKLEQEMKLLQEARLAMLRACQGNGNGDAKDRQNGLGRGNATGKRPMGADDPKTKVVNQRQPAAADPKAQQHATGFVKGGTFRKIAATDVAGAFKQAVQDAPEAIDRQRIPPDYADITRGYFHNLGGQK